MGCGCDTTILKYIKPPFADKFYYACCIHDYEYGKGGTRQDRLNADKHLYKNMLWITMLTEDCPCKISIYSAIALLYFISVRIFGGLYFHYKN